MINGNVNEISNRIEETELYLNIPSMIVNNETNENLQSFINNSKEIGSSDQFTLKDQIQNKLIPLEIKSTLVNEEESQFVFSLKDLSTYEELNNLKMKQKYSRIFVASI